jgi:hypothetical protein
MRKFWILVCVLGIPCVALGQSNPASWENLNLLQAGQRVQVVETNAKKDSGTFVSVSDTAISLEGEGGEQTIRKQDVRNVKLMENKHRMRNTLIGAAVGAGAGAGITAGTWENHGVLGDKGTGATVGAVIGAAAGAIVGAVWPSHKTIYRAS